MEINDTLICRLCLKICVSDYEPIESAALEMLNFLLLNLNLGISNEPIACDNCMANLRKCVDFKKSCLQVRDPIVLSDEDDDYLSNVQKPCPKDETPSEELTVLSVEDEDDMPNVSQMCLSEKVDVVNTTDNSDGTSVCGFCMKLITCKPCMFMKNYDADMIVKVGKYFPELGLNITKNSIMCTSCDESLHHYFAFINSCLNVEDKIRDYCVVEGTSSKGQIELSNILQYTAKDVLENKKDNSSPLADQTKEYCEQTEDESFETEVKNEECLEIEEQDLDVEDNDIKIGIESSHCDSYQNSVPSVQQPKTDTTLTEEEVKITALKCHLCKYKANHADSLRRHIQVHNLPVCKCDICGFETKHIAKHMKIHKNTSEVRMYKCEVCGFQTKQPCGLTRHMLNHKSLAEVPTYQCDICLYHTKQKGDLRKHLQLHKSDAEVTMHKCEVCSFQTRRKTGLRIHMVTHMSSAEATFYECEVCAFKSKHARNLSRHMKSHKGSSNMRWYECHTCGRQTRNKTSLRAHVMTHMPNK